MTNRTQVSTKFTTLISTLKELEESSNSLLKKLDPVMSNVSGENSTIVNEYIKKKSLADTQENRKKISSIMINVLSLWVKDALSVKKEVDNFIKLESAGFIIQRTECPFLTEVWDGDAYDKYEIAGFLQLKEDLKSQFNKYTREALFLSVTKEM